MPVRIVQWLREFGVFNAKWNVKHLKPKYHRHCTKKEVFYYGFLQ